MGKNAHIQCPICNSVMKSPQGLHGHLRFKHDIWDDELDRVFEQAQKNHVVAESEERQESESVTGGDSAPTEPPQAPSLDHKESLETMLSRIEGLREELETHDRSESFFGIIPVRRDEGPKEALEALDEMEMVVRERLGTGKADDGLRRRVDNSLDEMGSLVECRRQREAIQKKFSGERAEKRVQKLDRREASIRSHVRQEWDVGTPIEDLPDADPVTEQ